MLNEPIKINLDKYTSFNVFKELLAYAEFNRTTNIDLKMSSNGIEGKAYFFKEGNNNFIGWSGDYDKHFVHSASYYENKATYRVIEAKDFLDYVKSIKDKTEKWEPAHKEPVWCWDDLDETVRELRFWNLKSNRPFGKSKENLNVIKYKYYAKVENIEDWMIVAQSKLPKN